jgi:hypothetical protein
MPTSFTHSGNNSHSNPAPALFQASAIPYGAHPRGAKLHSAYPQHQQAPEHSSPSKHGTGNNVKANGDTLSASAAVCTSTDFVQQLFGRYEALLLDQNRELRETLHEANGRIKELEDAQRGRRTASECSVENSCQAATAQQKSSCEKRGRGDSEERAEGARALETGQVTSGRSECEPQRKRGRK